MNVINNYIFSQSRIREASVFDFRSIKFLAHLRNGKYVLTYYYCVLIVSFLSYVPFGEYFNC